MVVDHTCQPWKLKELKQHNLRIPNNTDIVKEEAYHLTHIKVVFDLRTRTPRCLCKVCDSAESRQSTPITGKFAKYDNVDLRLSKFISDHQYFLCFSHVYAFVLKDRVWGKEFLVLKLWRLGTDYLFSRLAGCAYIGGPKDGQEYYRHSGNGTREQQTDDQNDL